MIIKSFVLEKDIKLILNYKAILFYGENEGLKNDFKISLKKNFDKFDILNYFQDEIIKKENNLLQEIFNRSLFEKEKIIFINQASDKIVNILNQLIEENENVKIIFFSEVLDKKSKLRNYFEKSKLCGSVACYPDNEIAIRKIIEKKLNGYSGLTPQIINSIIQNSDLNRNKVNNEIEKIITFFQDKKIDADKLETLLNHKINDDFDKLRDEALNGNKNNTNRLLADTVFDTENNFFYLNSINQRINKLNEIEDLKKTGKNVELVVSQLKPPIFWKDKPIIIEQSKKWSKDKIITILKKTYNAEIELKSNSSIKKDLLIKNLLVEICYTANSV